MWTMHTASWRRHIWPTPPGPPGRKLLDFVGRSLEISVSDPVLYKGVYPRAAVSGAAGAAEKTPGRYTFGCFAGAGDPVPAGRQHPPLPRPDQVVEGAAVLHRGALFEWRIYQGGFDLPQLGRPA